MREANSEAVKTTGPGVVKAATYRLFPPNCPLQSRAGLGRTE